MNKFVISHPIFVDYIKKKFVAVQEVQHEHNLCNQDPDLFPIHCIEPEEDDDYGKKNATH